MDFTSTVACFVIADNIKEAWNLSYELSCETWAIFVWLVLALIYTQSTSHYNMAWKILKGASDEAYMITYNSPFSWRGNVNIHPFRVTIVCLLHHFTHIKVCKLSQ